MTVDQSEVIDFIGIDRMSGAVVLTISDHLYWGNDEHLIILQNKLNTYLRFIESEELIQTYPDAKDKNIIVEIVYTHKPDIKGKNLLEKAAGIFKGAGLELRSREFVSG